VLPKEFEFVKTTFDLLENIDCKDLKIPKDSEEYHNMNTIEKFAFELFSAKEQYLGNDNYINLLINFMPSTLELFIYEDLLENKIEVESRKDLLLKRLNFTHQKLNAISRYTIINGSHKNQKAFIQKYYIKNNSLICDNEKIHLSQKEIKKIIERSGY